MISISCEKCSTRNKFSTAGLKQCRNCSHIFRISEEQLLAAAPPPEQEPEIGDAGYLELFPENGHLAQRFTLRMGRQIIGRKSAVRPCDIMIETTDEFLHRNHFVIDVVLTKKKMIVFRISYAEKAVNNILLIKSGAGNPFRLGRDAFAELETGDVIQAGETKLVFHTSDSVQSTNHDTLKAARSGTVLAKDAM